jgi:hypothetical protein
MPAFRLSDQPVATGKFDVFGQDSASVAHFVRHVGLCGEDRNGHQAHEPLALVHMVPQLSLGDGQVQCVGSAGLTVDEINEIGVFVDERSSEYEASQRRDPKQQYVVHPHAKPVTSSDGTVICTQFSCAGFVIEAYNAVGIPLISDDEGVFPESDVETLVSAYPDLERYLRSPARKMVGLEGDGPWPVVLAGHVINSLRRNVGRIRQEPYLPQSGDAFFPAT